MFNKYLLPVIVALLIVFAVGHALYIQRVEPESPPPVPPPTTPFGNTVAGAGMVEPNTPASGTGVISVGSQLSGAVTKVWVRIGQEVKAGDLLIDLDRSQTESDWKVRKANLVAAEAQLTRLRLQPRPEEVPVSQALVDVADATFRQQKDQYDRGRMMLAAKSIAKEDFVVREQNFHLSGAQLEYAKASLALLKAGAWEPDIAIAAANVDLARAQVDQSKTTLDLMQIRAPVNGTILQVNVRPSEFVATSSGQSLILMGNLRPLHVRVNVDEEDIPRLKLNAPASAKIRGDAKQEAIPLTFVRLEPFVVPKVSLTGINIERVDTRVVQLIYAIEPNHPMVQANKVLVGQIVDVFIDTRPTSVSPGSP
jgi:multidrug efflux pump subunit AcrA (membrane-fusion protein)